MLAEALKALTDLAVKAATPAKIDVPDPRAYHFALNGSGRELALNPPPRNHKPACLADVATLANRFAAVGATKPVVWYDHEAVVLVIDDADTEDADGHRLERATLKLDASDVFAVLTSLREKRPWWDHKSFVRLLRIDLAGTLDPAALLNTIRKVRFENGQVTTAKVGKHDESMGREINAAVSGEGDIPEAVTLTAPAFKTPGEADPYPVRCTVEVDALEGRFRLMPLPDEIERVRSLALSSLASRLTAELCDGIPAYHGKP